MATHTQRQLVELTVEIVKCAVGNNGEQSIQVVNHPKVTTDYMQAVYDKLKELSEE